ASSIVTGVPGGRGSHRRTTAVPWLGGASHSATGCFASVQKVLPTYLSTGIGSGAAVPVATTQPAHRSGEARETTITAILIPSAPMIGLSYPAFRFAGLALRVSTTSAAGPLP